MNFSWEVATYFRCFTVLSGYKTLSRMYATCLIFCFFTILLFFLLFFARLLFYFFLCINFILHFLTYLFSEIHFLLYEFFLYAYHFDFIVIHGFFSLSYFGFFARLLDNVSFWLCIWLHFCYEISYVLLNLIVF